MGRWSLRSRRSEDIARVVMAVFVVAGALVMLMVVRGGTSIVEVPVEEITVGADDITVRAVVWLNTCGEPDRLLFEATPTAVRVTARVRRRSGDCEDIGISHPMTGTLTEPLAGRTLSSG